MEELKVKITTWDNPYNPFTEPQEWYLYDNDKGWRTAETLDYLSGNRDDYLDNTEYLERLSTAINYMLDEHPMNGIWCIVRESDKCPLDISKMSDISL